MFNWNYNRAGHFGHLCELPSKCTRLDHFSLAQKFTPLPPPLRISSYSLVSQAAFRAFSFFFLFDNFRNSGNIFPRIFCRDQFTPFLNRRTHIDQSAVKAQENNLLATLSSMWQTEDSYFYENFYLKTF